MYRGLLLRVAISGWMLLVSCAWAPARTAPPETLLSEKSVLYVRFDGLAPHAKSYAATALADVLAGDAGRFTAYLSDMLTTNAGKSAMKDSLLDGLEPQPLLDLQQALTEMPALVEGLRQNGFAAGVEITDVFSQHVQATIVFPEMGTADRYETILAALRMVASLNQLTTTKRPIGDREVVSIAGLGDIQVACWREGEHAVVSIGHEAPEYTIERFSQTARRNLTDHPLFQEVSGFHDYETVVRGFADLQGLVQQVSKLVAPLPMYLEALGLTNVRHAALYVGFDGRRQRSTFELAVPGDRKGLLRSLRKPNGVDLARLPPLPAEASLVSAWHLDATEGYDGFHEAVDAVGKLLGGNIVADAVRDFERQVHEHLGLDLRQELLALLGPTVVLYSAPAEGIAMSGVSLAIEVPDGARVRKTLDVLASVLVDELGDDARFEDHDYEGVRVTKLRAGRNTPFLPSFAVHRGWLVISLNPQPVHAFVLRSEGKLPGWKPHPLVAEARALAARGNTQAKFLITTQVDPRPGIDFILSTMPMIGALIESSESSATFDATLVPVAASICQWIEPGVSVTVDDGRTLRMETFESLPLSTIFGPVDFHLMAFVFGLRF